MKPNSLFLSIITISTVALFACSARQIAAQPISPNASATTAKNKIIGFNLNWRYFPHVDNPVMINNIKKLAPDMIRYPGGTITHDWDWRTGTAKTKKNAKDFVHPLEDLKKLLTATGVKVVFDLDIVHSTVDDQLEMLHTAQSLGIAVDYIELGNELYSASKEHGYEVPFPTGAAYADTANVWIAKIRKAFPNAKIAVVHVAKKNGTPRMDNWNKDVERVIKDIDAVTYHLYISENQNFEKRKQIFLDAYYNPSNRPVWFTEYGKMGSANQPGYLAELTQLADYLESFPQATIILNHTLITHSEDRGKLLKPTGNSFTKEGEMFVKRAEARK